MAAVLGHETGHVTAKHSLAGYQRAIASNVLIAGVVLGTGDARGSRNCRDHRIPPRERLLRDQEREADWIGIDYMVKAGYNPEGAVRLQELFLHAAGGRKEPHVGRRALPHPPVLEGAPRQRPRTDRAAISGHGEEPELHLQRGDLRQKTARLREVQKAYEIADQGTSSSRRNGTTRRSRGTAEAERMEPGQSPFHSSAGQVYLAQKKYAAAEEETAERRSSSTGVLRATPPDGALRYQQKEYRAAIPQLERSMELYPTKSAAALLSKSYEAVGDAANAKSTPTWHGDGVLRGIIFRYPIMKGILLAREEFIPKWIAWK